MGTRHFECRTFDLSDNSPYISSVILAPEECKKNTQERYEIVKSEPAQSPVRRTFSADETAGASKNFECDPFDLLGNAPYSNPPKSSPEKGEKSRREQQIFNCRKQWIFDDGSLENQEKLPKCLLDFESISLRPLRYACLYILAPPRTAFGKMRDFDAR